MLNLTNAPKYMIFFIALIANVCIQGRHFVYGGTSVFNVQRCHNDHKSAFTKIQPQRRRRIDLSLISTSNGFKEDVRIALCGGIAGATGTAILYPFDTAKTLRQAQPKVYRNVHSALMSLFNDGFYRGARMAYSGVLMSTLGAIPSSAMYFGSYSLAKSRLENLFYKSLYRQKEHRDEKICVYSYDDRARTLSLLQRVIVHSLSAATGNTISSLIFVPKEYIKQQMQTIYSKGSLSSAVRSQHRGVRSNEIELVLNIVKEKGICELYSGYRATLMRNVPSAILRFGLYEELKLRLSEKDSDDVSFSPRFFVAGLAAGACSSAIMTPLDVIKTRLATHTIPGNVNTVFGAARAIFVENGINGLYAGVGARIMWSGMFSAIGFGTFETCKRYLFVPNPRIQAVSDC